MVSRSIDVSCPFCNHINTLIIDRIYDGFEGIFLCDRCNQPLENLHETLEEE